ncbi:unnamed protein product [Pleuronectes platessa]|uniref:Uncharacterized protein n=1 Tax=Pleuronectes platessa TaxID=8262 RepID=A0A9N7Z5J6_PLEPL|nr:unnamed protein product [Pleuronectes platessa]
MASSLLFQGQQLTAGVSDRPGDTTGVFICWQENNSRYFRMEPEMKHPEPWIHREAAVPERRPPPHGATRSHLFPYTLFPYTLFPYTLFPYTLFQGQSQFGSDWNQEPSGSKT